jgi:hypothetical protein
MLNITCNIDQSDRINRVVFGAMILLGVLFMSKFYFILLALIMIVEGIVGWCGIPGLVARLKALVGK